MMGWLVAAMTLASGCFLPPSLSPEENPDAGLNSIPVILGSPFSATGVVPIQRERQEPLTLNVRDLDRGDSIFVFFYVDYGLPERGPPLGECRASGGAFERQLTCDLNSLCYRIPKPDNELHFLEAIVSDQDRLDSGEPQNRAFPAGAGVSQRAWLMNCVD